MNSGGIKQKAAIRIVWITLLGFSCVPSKEYQNDSTQLISETSKEFLDQIAKIEGLTNSYLVHTELENDKAKEIFIEGSIKQGLISGADIDLVKSINKNSVNYRFPENFRFGVDNKIVESFDEVDENNDDLVFGSINITDPAIDYKKQIGCYYFAINCGKDCSKGFLVFAIKRNFTWVIEKIIPLWEG